MNWIALWPAIPAFFIALALHNIDVIDIRNQQTKALAEQKETLIKQCADEKKISEDISNAYEKKITALNKQLAVIRVRPKPRCVMPVAAKTNGLDDSARQPKLVGTYGFSTEWLYDYAGEAEKYRLQLIGLQDFINKTWEINK